MSRFWVCLTRDRKGRREATEPDLASVSNREGRGKATEPDLVSIRGREGRREATKPDLAMVDCGHLDSGSVTVDHGFTLCNELLLTGGRGTLSSAGLD